MNLIYIILVGSIIGWVTAKVINKNGNTAISTITGITGAFIGSVLMMLFLSSDYTYLDFTWWGAFWSAFGATLLSIVMNLSERSVDVMPPTKDQSNIGR